MTRQLLDPIGLVSGLEEDRPLAVLREDRARLTVLLEEFERSGGRPEEERRVLAHRIFSVAEIHARLEEEILYPELRPLTDREGREEIYDAVAEHRIMATLARELRRLGTDDPRYAPRFAVYRDTLLRHLAEENDGVLPDAELLLEDDLEELDERMWALRRTLDPETAAAEAGIWPGALRDRAARLLAPRNGETGAEAEPPHRAASA